MNSYFVEFRNKHPSLITVPQKCEKFKERPRRSLDNLRYFILSYLKTLQDNPNDIFEFVNTFKLLDICCVKSIPNGHMHS